MSGGERRTAVLEHILKMGVTFACYVSAVFQNPDTTLNSLFLVSSTARTEKSTHMRTTRVNSERETDGLSSLSTFDSVRNQIKPQLVLLGHQKRKLIGTSPLIKGSRGDLYIKGQRNSK